jgi:hypothetical protein
VPAEPEPGSLNLKIETMAENTDTLRDGFQQLFVHAGGHKRSLRGALPSVWWTRGVKTFESVIVY